MIGGRGNGPAVDKMQGARFRVYRAEALRRGRGSWQGTRGKVQMV